MRRAAISGLVMIASACAAPAEVIAPEPTGLAILGSGTHDPARVVIETVLTEADGLVAPTDVAFPTGVTPMQAWITDRGDDGVVVRVGDGDDVTVSAVHGALGSTHFMARPSSLDFGVEGRFATTQDTDERTQTFTDVDFMGPTLWTSSLDAFDGGHASHYDMLHNSPNAQGIAWDHDNVYWVADGWHRSLTRYDFQHDHGPGGEDHVDGIIARYGDGLHGYVEDVPGHLALDRTHARLYAADPEHARITVLDTASGTRGADIEDNYDFCDAYVMNDAVLETLVEGEPLVQPSGMALHGDLLFVSDHATSRILAFDLDGVLVDWLDLSTFRASAGVAGLAFDETGRLWVVLTNAREVIRISSLP
jgi:hypothetical protein